MIYIPGIALYDEGEAGYDDTREPCRPGTQTKVAAGQRKGYNKVGVPTEIRYIETKRSSWFTRNAKYKYVYLMLLPVLVYYTVFHYGPMYGAMIAFKDFRPFLGFAEKPLGRFQTLSDVLQSYYFWRLVRNTISINILDIVFHFPAPIILALLLNEVTNRFFKRTVQSISYMPHFISVVVVAGLILNFCQSRRPIQRHSWLCSASRRARFSPTPSISSRSTSPPSIWQQVGWGSIIYLASLTSVDPQLYEQATVDGAGRFRQMLHITLPGIAPTIIIMVILRFGRMMSVGFEKVLLLYNPMIYETADVISTFVYRQGLLNQEFSYAAAVGLFNSAINFALVVTVNQISRKVSETSLW